MVPLRRRVRKVLRERGWELRRIPTVPVLPQADQWIRDLGAMTVLDIGANVGQFAREIRVILPDAHIISFEPLAECFDSLVKVTHEIGNAQAHRLALGADSGPTVMNRSDFSQSSSIRPMTSLHMEAFPYTAGHTPETITIARLDDLDLDLVDPLFVKIDVQGYEDRVVEGGRRTLERAVGIVVESSFHPLYEDAPLFADIVELFTGLGFAYCGARNQLFDPRNGLPLQENSIFLRAGATASAPPP